MVTAKVLNMKDCENYVICSTKTGKQKIKCKKKCDEVRKGFVTVPFIPPKIGNNAIDNISDELHDNLVTKLLTGEMDGKINNEYGKVYYKEMDTEISLPFTRKTLNANCTINGKKHRQYMKINGITIDENIKNIHVNLPIKPKKDEPGWKALVAVSKFNKDNIGDILIKLKKECPTFLYDQGVNTNGKWDPQNKLSIPPNCADKLWPIINTIGAQYNNNEKKKLYSHLVAKHIVGLKGLIPSIASDFIEIGKVGMDFATKGTNSNIMKYFQTDNNKCEEIVDELGELTYDAKGTRNNLTQYKAFGIDPLDIVDEFQNYNDTSLLSMIVLSILIVILFILKSIL